MNIAQRGTSSTSSSYQTVDRIIHTGTGWDEAMTQSQSDVASGTTPYTLGFRKAFKITNGNQTSGAGSNDYVWIQQKIEAHNIAQSGWNYLSSSSFITLSFWVKSSVAQTFKGYIETIDGTAYQYPFETGSLSANTWTKVIKTIPGNSNIQFDDDVNQGLQIAWNMFAGTNYTDSGVSLNAWGAFDTNAQYPDNTTTWFTTNDATWNITGLQLELGTQATPFEHRSFGEELQLCKRYYQKSYAYETAPGTADSFLNQMIGRAYATVTNRMDLRTRFEVEMRTTPTITTYTPSGGTTGKVEDYASGTGTAAGTARDVAAVRNLGNKGFGGISVSPSQDGVLGVHYTADAEI